MDVYSLPSAVSLSLHLPRLLFLLLKQAGLSRPGEAALRSVWIARSRQKEFVNSLRSPSLFFLHLQRNGWITEFQTFSLLAKLGFVLHNRNRCV